VLNRTYHVLTTLCPQNYLTTARDSHYKPLLSVNAPRLTLWSEGSLCYLREKL